MKWGIENWPTIRARKRVKANPDMDPSQEKPETVGDDMNLLQREDQLGEKVAKDEAPRTVLQDPPGPSAQSQTKIATSSVGTYGTTPVTATTPTVPATPATDSTTKVPGPALPAPPAATGGQPHTTTSAFIIVGYTNIVVFDQHVLDAKNSLVGLEVLRSELCSIMMRERNDAEAIIARMNDRRLIWKGLLARLNNAIVSASCQRLVESMEEGKGLWIE
jgi:hypothetical protein